nr:hypothetical protein [Morchella crassipes]
MQGAPLGSLACRFYLHARARFHPSDQRTRPLSTSPEPPLGGPPEGGPPWVHGLPEGLPKRGEVCYSLDSKELERERGGVCISWVGPNTPPIRDGGGGGVTQGTLPAGWPAPFSTPPDLHLAHIVFHYVGDN